jgi:single-strand DNA-binding protein
MIESLVNGKLIKNAELKTSASGTKFCNFLLSVNVGEPNNIVMSAIAFNEIAERIALLQAKDALSLAGTLKPAEWSDKATGQQKHGLNLTVSNFLSLYDIKQRKPKQAD